MKQTLPSSALEEVRGYRTQLEIRDAVGTAGNYRYLEGRAVPYEVWGDVGYFLELHRAGSFERSCRGGSGRQLPLLLWHDNRNWPIGHAERWRDEEDGLEGVWRLNDSDQAQRAAQFAVDGDLSGLSVGFHPVRSEPVELADDWAPHLGTKYKDRIVRLESRLLETSLTPTPVFADAEVTLVRSAHPRPTLEVDTWREELEKLRSG